MERRPSNSQDRNTTEGLPKGSQLVNSPLCSKPLTESICSWLEKILKEETETAPSKHKYSTRLNPHREDTINTRPSTPSTLLESDMGKTGTTADQPNTDNGTDITESEIQRADYIKDNLGSNKIFIQREEMPHYVQDAFEWIENRRVEYPSLRIQDMDILLQRLVNLQIKYVLEERITGLLRNLKLVRMLGPEDEPLDSSSRVPFHSSLVPSSNVSIRSKVSVPFPDMVYGYIDGAFTESQELAMRTVQLYPPCGSVNKELVSFPFLTIEVKGPDPLQWAINQCLGGAATMARIVGNLNEHIDKFSAVPLLDTTCFSIAANQYTAILFVTWRNEKKEYHTKQLKLFGISADDPDSIHKLGAYINAILDWGRTERLSKIQDALDSLLAKSCEECSAEAKVRPAPHKDDDGSRVSKVVKCTHV